MKMNDTKQWWKSRGVMGGLFTVVIGILVSFGVLTPDIQNPEAVNSVTDNYLHIVAGVSTIISGAIAFWGRVKASSRIGKE